MSFQLDLFGSYDVPEELILAEKITTTYPWKSIQEYIEPRFRRSAVEFHNRHIAAHSNDMAEEQDPLLVQPTQEKPEPQTSKEYTTMEQIINFFRKRNSKGAGRKPQPFLAYLKAFILAPVLHIEPDCTHMADALRSNPFFLALCGFSYPPSARTLQDFDQIMRQSDLWEAMEKQSFGNNVRARLIQPDKEHTLNVDPTDFRADSTPGKKTKTCRECRYRKTCPHPEPTDETAGWYQKSRWKGSYAHMIGMSQLARSGAPFSWVIMNGRLDERKCIKPLLVKGKQDHPEFTFGHINADGNFNYAHCREAVQESYPGAHFHSPTNAGRQKDIENYGNGIKKVTAKGTVICEEGHTLVLMGQDKRHDSYCFACPIYNQRARKRAERMSRKELPSHCTSKSICSPTSTQGRFLRVPRTHMNKLDPHVPQGSYRFWYFYRLRTKIERLFCRLKDRFRMTLHNLRGRLAIESLLSKFCSVVHIVAYTTGTYGV